jgi:hypothetical protein
MSLDLKPLVKALFDTGSESFAAEGRKLIVLAGVIGLVLILVWKRG